MVDGARAGDAHRVDIARVDHFRGFAACWEIPGGDKTAERGQWVEAPGKELFTAIRKTLGDLPIIAEDLGVITPDVEALRENFSFPVCGFFSLVSAATGRNQSSAQL